MSSEEDFHREYEALRRGISFFQLGAWTSLSVAGADRLKFLNNFCTNDVKRLQLNEQCEAFVTSVKGRVTGHVLVDNRKDELVLIGAPNQGETLLHHLDRYIIRDDVQLRDLAAERRYVLVSTPPAAGLGDDLAARFVAWNLIGRATSGLLEVHASESTRVVGRLQEAGYVQVGPTAFDAARIESGMPLFGIDFDDHNFPQEINRDSLAISFTKGCYLGQETVARIDALGHVNQQLTGVQFLKGSLPQVGSPLTHDGVVVGEVKSVELSPQLGVPLAIALLRREVLTEGTRLSSEFGDGRVIALPLS